MTNNTGLPIGLKHQKSYKEIQVMSYGIHKYRKYYAKKCFEQEKGFDWTDYIWNHCAYMFWKENDQNIKNAKAKNAKMENCQNIGNAQT